MGIAFAALVTGPLVWALVRYGLLHTLAAYFVWSVLFSAPTTLDPSNLYAGISAWVMAIIAGLMALGFYLSRGGEPLLGKLIPATEAGLRHSSLVVFTFVPLVPDGSYPLHEITGSRG